MSCIPHCRLDYIGLGTMGFTARLLSMATAFACYWRKEILIIERSAGWLDSKGPQGAKPKAEAIATIVSDIRERRA